MLVAWNILWWDFLYHGSHQNLQIRTFLFFPFSHPPSLPPFHPFSLPCVLPSFLPPFILSFFSSFLQRLVVKLLQAHHCQQMLMIIEISFSPGQTEPTAESAFGNIRPGFLIISWLPPYSPWHCRPRKPPDISQKEPGPGRGDNAIPSAELLDEAASTTVGLTMEEPPRSKKQAQLLLAMLAASSWLPLTGPALSFLCLREGAAGTEPL